MERETEIKTDKERDRETEEPVLMLVKNLRAIWSPKLDGR
jgi:hypothetical protein